MCVDNEDSELSVGAAHYKTPGRIDVQCHAVLYINFIGSVLMC